MNLQVVALLIGWVSAVLGIWAKGFTKPLLPAVATAVTTLGLAVGIVLTNRSAANSERALQAARRQMNATLAATELGKLRVEWNFADVPQRVLDVFAIADSIDNANRLSDDEIDRLAPDWNAKMRQSWYIDNKITPLVRAAATGAMDIAPYYEGGEDVAKAIVVWSNGGPVEPQSADAWLHTPYDGQAYDLLFPLNSDSSAALVLGKKQDDELRPLNADLVGQERYFHEITNYGFDAAAERTGAGFSLSWTYDLPSLKRAVVRKLPEARVYAGMPEEFAFVVVNKALARTDYLELPAHHFRDTVEEPGENAPWFAHSELRVFVNGQPDASYVYSVTRGKPRVETIQWSTYDDPEPQYTYTAFHCKLDLPQ